MTICRSDKFKSLYSFVQAFEFIRSEKGHKLNILKLFVRIKLNMQIMTKKHPTHCAKTQQNSL